MDRREKSLPLPQTSSNRKSRVPPKGRNKRGDTTPRRFRTESLGELAAKGKHVLESRRPASVRTKSLTQRPSVSPAFASSKGSKDLHLTSIDCAKGVKEWEAMEIRILDKDKCTVLRPKISNAHISDQLLLQSSFYADSHTNKSNANRKHSFSSGSIRKQTVCVEKVHIKNLLHTKREKCGNLGSSRSSEYMPSETATVSATFTAQTDSPLRPSKRSIRHHASVGSNDSTDVNNAESLSVCRQYGRKIAGKEAGKMLGGLGDGSSTEVDFKDDNFDDESDDIDHEDSEVESDTDDSKDDDDDSDEVEEDKESEDDVYPESDTQFVSDDAFSKKGQINKPYDKNLGISDISTLETKQNSTSRSENTSVRLHFSNVSETSMSTTQNKNFDTALSRLNLYNARSSDIIQTSRPADTCDKIKYRKTYVDDWPIALDESNRPFYTFQLYDNETPERTHTTGGDTTTNLNETSTTLSTSEGKKWEALQHRQEECYRGTQSISKLTNTLSKKISCIPMSEEEIARYKQIALQILLERKQSALGENKGLEVQTLSPKKVTEVQPRHGGKKKRKLHNSARLKSKDPGKLSDASLQTNSRSSQWPSFWTPRRMKNQIEKHRERFHLIDQGKMPRSRNTHITQTGRGLKQFSKQSPYKERNSTQESTTPCTESFGSKNQKITSQALRQGQTKGILQQLDRSKVKGGVLVRKSPSRGQKLSPKKHTIFSGSSQSTVKKSTSTTLSQQQMKTTRKTSAGRTKTAKTGTPTNGEKCPANNGKTTSATSFQAIGKTEDREQLKRAGSVIQSKMNTAINNGKQNYHSVDSNLINNIDLTKTSSHDETLPTGKIQSSSVSTRSYLSSTKSQTQKQNEREQILEKPVLSSAPERHLSQRDQVIENERKVDATTSTSIRDSATLDGEVKASTKPGQYFELLQNILKSPTAKAAQALGMFLQKPQAPNAVDRECDLTVDQIITSYQKIFDQLYAISTKGNANTKPNDKDKLTQALANSITSLVIKTSSGMPTQEDALCGPRNVPGTDAVPMQCKEPLNDKGQSCSSRIPLNGVDAKSLKNVPSHESSASGTAASALVRDEMAKHGSKMKENAKSLPPSEHEGPKLPKYKSEHAGRRLKSTISIGIPKYQGRPQEDDQSPQANKPVAGGKRSAVKSPKVPFDKSKSSHDSTEGMKGTDKQQCNRSNENRNIPEINVANREQPVQHVENITNQLPRGWSGVCQKVAADVPHNLTTAMVFRKTSLSDSSCCTNKAKVNSTHKTSSCTRQLLTRRVQVGTNLKEIPVFVYTSEKTGNDSCDKIIDVSKLKSIENDLTSSTNVVLTNKSVKPIDCMGSVQTTPDNNSHLSNNVVPHKECKRRIKTHALVASKSQERATTANRSKHRQARAFIKGRDKTLENQGTENEKCATSAQNLKVGAQHQDLKTHAKSSDTIHCSSEADGTLRAYPAITIFAPQACLNILTPKYSPHSSQSEGPSERRAVANGRSDNVQSCLQSTSFSKASNSTTFIDPKTANQMREPKKKTLTKLPTPVIEVKPLRSALKSKSEHWTSRVESCHKGIQREVPNSVTSGGQKQVHFNCRSAFKYGFSASSSTVMQFPSQDDQTVYGVSRPYKKASYIVPSSGFSKLNTQKERSTKAVENQSNMTFVLSPPRPKFTRNLQVSTSQDGKHIFGDEAVSSPRDSLGELEQTLSLKQSPREFEQTLNLKPSPRELEQTHILKPSPRELEQTLSLKQSPRELEQTLILKPSPRELEQTLILKPHLKYPEVRHLPTNSIHSDLSKCETHRDTLDATKISLSWSKQHLTKTQDMKDKHFVSSAALKAILLTPFPRANNIFRNDGETGRRVLARQSWRSRSAEGYELKNATSRNALQCMKNDNILKKIVLTETFPSPRSAKTFQSELQPRACMSYGAITPEKPPSKFLESGMNAKTKVKNEGLSENKSCVEMTELNHSTKAGLKALSMTSSACHILDRNSTPGTCTLEQKMCERKSATASPWKSVSEDESEISDGSSLQAVRKHTVASTCRMIIRESRNLMVSNLHKHFREESPQRAISRDVQSEHDDKEINSVSNDFSRCVGTPIFKYMKEVPNNSSSLSGTRGSDVAQCEDVSSKHHGHTVNVETSTSKCATPSILSTKSGSEQNEHGSKCINERHFVWQGDQDKEIAKISSDDKSLSKDNESCTNKGISHPEVTIRESVIAVARPRETEFGGKTQNQYIPNSSALETKQLLPTFQTITLQQSQYSSDKSLQSHQEEKSQVFSGNKNISLLTNGRGTELEIRNIGQESIDICQKSTDTEQRNEDIEKGSGDIEQGDRYITQGSSRDCGQGSSDLEQDNRDKGQGIIYNTQGSKDYGQGSRDIKDTSRDVEQGTRDIEQGTRDIEQNGRDIEQGGRDIEQGGRDIEQNGRDIEQGGRDIEQGDRDIEQDGRDMEQSDRDIEQSGINIEQGSRDKHQSGRDIEQGGRDIEQGSRDIKDTSRDVEQGTRDIELGTRDIEQNDRDIEQGGRDIEQGGRDIEQGGRDIEQNGRDIDQGGRDIEQDGRDIEQGGRDIEQCGRDKEQGGRDIQQGSRDIEQGSRDIEQGGRDIEQGGRDIQQGSRDIEQGGRDIEQGGRDIEQDGRDIEQDGRDKGQGGRDIEQGGRDIEQSGRDIEQHGRDIEQDGRDKGQGGRDKGQGGRDIEQGGRDIEHCGRDIEQCGRDLEQGGRDIKETRKDIGQGGINIEEIIRDIEQGSRYAEQGSGDTRQGTYSNKTGEGNKDIGQGSSEIGQGKRDMIQDKRDMGQDSRDRKDIRDSGQESRDTWSEIGYTRQKDDKDIIKRIRDVRKANIYAEMDSKYTEEVSRYIEQDNRYERLGSTYKVHNMKDLGEESSIYCGHRSRYAEQENIQTVQESLDTKQRGSNFVEENRDIRQQNRYTVPDNRDREQESNDIRHERKDTGQGDMRPVNIDTYKIIRFAGLHCINKEPEGGVIGQDNRSTRQGSRYTWQKNRDMRGICGMGTRLERRDVGKYFDLMESRNTEPRIIDLKQQNSYTESRIIDLKQQNSYTEPRIIDLKQQNSYTEPRIIDLKQQNSYTEPRIIDLKQQNNYTEPEGGYIDEESRYMWQVHKDIGQRGRCTEHGRRYIWQEGRETGQGIIAARYHSCGAKLENRDTEQKIRYLGQESTYARQSKKNIGRDICDGTSGRMKERRYVEQDIINIKNEIIYTGQGNRNVKHIMHENIVTGQNKDVRQENRDIQLESGDLGQGNRDVRHRGRDTELQEISIEQRNRNIGQFKAHKEQEEGFTEKERMFIANESRHPSQASRESMQESRDSSPKNRDVGPECRAARLYSSDREQGSRYTDYESRNIGQGNGFMWQISRYGGQKSSDQGQEIRNTGHECKYREQENRDTGQDYRDIGQESRYIVPVSNDRRQDSRNTAQGNSFIREGSICIGQERRDIMQDCRNLRQRSRFTEQDSRYSWQGNRESSHFHKGLESRDIELDNRETRQGCKVGRYIGQSREHMDQGSRDIGLVNIDAGHGRRWPNDGFTEQCTEMSKVTGIEHQDEETYLSLSKSRHHNDKSDTLIQREPEIFVDKNLLLREDLQTSKEQSEESEEHSVAIETYQRDFLKIKLDVKLQTSEEQTDKDGKRLENKITDMNAPTEVQAVKVHKTVETQLMPQYCNLSTVKKCKMLLPNKENINSTAQHQDFQDKMVTFVHVPPEKFDLAIREKNKYPNEDTSVENMIVFHKSKCNALMESDNVCEAGVQTLSYDYSNNLSGETVLSSCCNSEADFAGNEMKQNIDSGISAVSEVKDSLQVALRTDLLSPIQEQKLSEVDDEGIYQFASSSDHTCSMNILPQPAVAMLDQPSKEMSRFGRDLEKTIMKAGIVPDTNMRSSLIFKDKMINNNKIIAPSSCGSAMSQIENSATGEERDECIIYTDASVTTEETMEHIQERIRKTTIKSTQTGEHEGTTENSQKAQVRTDTFSLEGPEKRGSKEGFELLIHLKSLDKDVITVDNFTTDSTEPIDAYDHEVIATIQEPILTTDQTLQIETASSESFGVEFDHKVCVASQNGSQQRHFFHRGLQCDMLKSTSDELKKSRTATSDVIHELLLLPLICTSSNRHFRTNLSAQAHKDTHRPRSSFTTEDIFHQCRLPTDHVIQKLYSKITAQIVCDLNAFELGKGTLISRGSQCSILETLESEPFGTTEADATSATKGRVECTSSSRTESLGLDRTEEKVSQRCVYLHDTFTDTHSTEVLYSTQNHTLQARQPYKTCADLNEETFIQILIKSPDQEELVATYHSEQETTETDVLTSHEDQTESLCSCLTALAKPYFTISTVRNDDTKQMISVLQEMETEEEISQENLQVTESYGLDNDVGMNIRFPAEDNVSKTGTRKKERAETRRCKQEKHIAAKENKAKLKELGENMLKKCNKQTEENETVAGKWAFENSSLRRVCAAKNIKIGASEDRPSNRFEHVDGTDSIKLIGCDQKRVCNAGNNADIQTTSTGITPKRYTVNTPDNPISSSIQDTQLYQREDLFTISSSPQTRSTCLTDARDDGSSSKTTTYQREPLNSNKFVQTETSPYIRRPTYVYTRFEGDKQGLNKELQRRTSFSPKCTNNITVSHNETSTQTLLKQADFDGPNQTNTNDKKPQITVLRDCCIGTSDTDNNIDSFILREGISISHNNDMGAGNESQDAHVKSVASKIKTSKILRSPDSSQAKCASLRTLSRSSDVKHKLIHQKAMENLELFLKSMRESRVSSCAQETSPPWKPSSQPSGCDQGGICDKDLKNEKQTTSLSYLRQSILDIDSFSKNTKVQTDGSESVGDTLTISKRSTDDAQKQGIFSKQTSLYKDTETFSKEVLSAKPLMNLGVYGNSSLHMNAMNEQGLLKSLETHSTIPACSQICPGSEINWKKFQTAPKDQSDQQIPQLARARSSTVSLSSCMFHEKEPENAQIPRRSNTPAEQVKTILDISHALDACGTCRGDKEHVYWHPSQLIATVVGIKIPVLFYEGSRTIMTQPSTKEKSQSAIDFTTCCTNPFKPKSTNPFVSSAPLFLAPSSTHGKSSQIVLDQPSEPFSNPFSQIHMNKVTLNQDKSVEDGFVGQMSKSLLRKDIPAIGVSFVDEHIYDRPCLSAEEEFASFLGTELQDQFRSVHVDSQPTTLKPRGSGHISEEEDLMIFSDATQDTDDKKLKQETECLTFNSQMRGSPKSALSINDCTSPEASILASYKEDWFDRLIQGKNNTDLSFTKKSPERKKGKKKADKRGVNFRNFIERTSPDRSANGQHPNNRLHEKIQCNNGEVHPDGRETNTSIESFESEKKTSSDTLNNLASSEFTSHCLLLKRKHGLEKDDSLPQDNSSEETLDKVSTDSSKSSRSWASPQLESPSSFMHRETQKSLASTSRCRHQITDEETNLNILETVTTLTSKFIDMFNGLKKSMKMYSRRCFSKNKMPYLERKKQCRTSSKSVHLHRTHRYSSKKPRPTRQPDRKTSRKVKYHHKNSSQPYEQDMRKLHTLSGKKKTSVLKKARVVQSASTATIMQSVDHLASSEMSEKCGSIYRHRKRPGKRDELCTSPQLHTDYTRLPFYCSNSESPKATSSSSLNYKILSESHPRVDNPSIVACGKGSVSSKEQHAFFHMESHEDNHGCQQEIPKVRDDWSFDDMTSCPDYSPNMFIPQYSQFYLSVNNGGYPSPNLPFISTIFTFVDNMYEPFIPDQENYTPRLVLVDDEENGNSKKTDVITPAAAEVQKIPKQDIELPGTDKGTSEVMEEISFHDIASKCQKDSAIQQMIQKAMSAPGLSSNNAIRFEKVQLPSGSTVKYVDVVPLLRKSEVIFGKKVNEKDQASGFQEAMHISQDLDVSFTNKIIYDGNRENYINELVKDLNKSVCNIKSPNLSDISSSYLCCDIGRYSASGFPSLHGQYYIKDDFSSPPKRKKCDYSYRSARPAEASLSKDTRIIGHQSKRGYNQLKCIKESDKKTKCRRADVPFTGMVFENTSRSYRKKKNTYLYQEMAHKPVTFGKKLTESPLKEGGASVTYSFRGREEYLSHIIMDSSPLSDILTEFGGKQEILTEIEPRPRVKENRQCQYDDCEPDTYDELGSLCSEMQDTTSKLYPVDVDSDDNKGNSGSEVLSSVSPGQTLETLLGRETTGSQNSTSNAATQTIHQVKRCTSCSHYFSAIAECSYNELAKPDTRNDGLRHEQADTRNVGPKHDQAEGYFEDIERKSLPVSVRKIDFMVPRSAPIVRSRFTQTEVDAPGRSSHLPMAKLDKSTLMQVRKLMGRCIKSKNFKYYVQHIVDDRVRNTLQQAVSPGTVEKDKNVEKNEMFSLIKNKTKRHELITDSYPNAVKKVSKNLIQSSVPSFMCQETMEDHEVKTIALKTKLSQKPHPNDPMSMKYSNKNTENIDNKPDISWPQKSDNGKSARVYEHFRRSFEKVSRDTYPVNVKPQKAEILQSSQKPWSFHSKEVSGDKAIDDRMHQSLPILSVDNVQHTHTNPSAESFKLWCTTVTERTTTFQSCLSALDRITDNFSEYSFDFSRLRAHTFQDSQTNTPTNRSPRDKITTEESSNQIPASRVIKTPPDEKHLTEDSACLPQIQNNVEIHLEQRSSLRKETVKTKTDVHNTIEQTPAAANNEVRAVNSQHDTVCDYPVLGGDESLPGKTTEMSTDSAYPVHCALTAQEQSDISSSSSTKIDYGRLKHILSAESKLLWKNLTRLEKSYDRCKRCRKQYDSILGASKISEDYEAETDKLETHCELHSDDFNITQCSSHGTEMIDHCIREKNAMKTDETATMLTPKATFGLSSEMAGDNADRSMKRTENYSRRQMLHRLDVNQSPLKVTPDISDMVKVSELYQSSVKDSNTSDQHVLTKIIKEESCKKSWDVKGKKTARMIQIFERGNGFFQETESSGNTKCESGVDKCIYSDDKDFINLSSAMPSGVGDHVSPQQQNKSDHKTSLSYEVSLSDQKQNEQHAYKSYKKVHANVKKKEHTLSDQLSHICTEKHRKSRSLEDEVTKIGSMRTCQANDQAKKSKGIYETSSNFKFSPAVRPSSEKQDGMNQYTFPSTASIADVQHILAMNAPNSETDEWIQKLVNILHEMQQAFPHISATHTHSTLKRDQTSESACFAKTSEMSSCSRLSDATGKVAGFHEKSDFDQEIHKCTDVNITTAHILTATTDSDKCHNVSTAITSSETHTSNNCSSLQKNMIPPDNLVNDIQVVDDKPYRSAKTASNITDITVDINTKETEKSDKVTPYPWLLKSSNPLSAFGADTTNLLELASHPDCRPMDENNQASGGLFLVQQQGQTNAPVCQITLKEHDKNVDFPQQNCGDKMKNLMKISRNTCSEIHHTPVPDEETQFSVHVTKNCNRVLSTIKTFEKTTEPSAITRIKWNSSSGNDTLGLKCDQLNNSEEICRTCKRDEVLSLSRGVRRTPVRLLEKSSSLVNLSQALIKSDSEKTFCMLDYLNLSLPTKFSAYYSTKEKDKYFSHIPFLPEIYSDTQGKEQEIHVSVTNTTPQVGKIPTQASAQYSFEEDIFESMVNIHSKTSIPHLCLDQCKDMVEDNLRVDVLLSEEGGHLPASLSHRNYEKQVDKTETELWCPQQTAVEQVNEIPPVTSTFNESSDQVNLTPDYKLQRPDVSMSSKNQYTADITECSQCHVWQRKSKQFSSRSDDERQFRENCGMTISTMNDIINSSSNDENVLSPNDTLTSTRDNAGSMVNSCQLSNTIQIGESARSLAIASSFHERKIPFTRSSKCALNLSPVGKSNSLLENTSPDRSILYDSKKQNRKCYGQDGCPYGATEIAQCDTATMNLYDKVVDRKSLSPASQSPREYVSRDSTTSNKDISQSSGKIRNLSDTIFRSGNLESAHQQTIQMQSFEIPIDIYTVPVRRCISPQKKKKKKADMPTRTVVISGPVRNMSIAVQRHMMSYQQESDAATDRNCPDSVDGTASSHRVSDPVTLGGDDRKSTQNWRHAVKRMLPFGKRTTSNEKDKKLPTQMLTKNCPKKHQFVGNASQCFN